MGEGKEEREACTGEKAAKRVEVGREPVAIGDVLCRHAATSRRRLIASRAASGASRPRWIHSGGEEVGFRSGSWSVGGVQSRLVSFSSRTKTNNSLYASLVSNRTTSNYPERASFRTILVKTNGALGPGDIGGRGGRQFGPVNDVRRMSKFGRKNLTGTFFFSGPAGKFDISGFSLIFHRNCEA